MALQTPQVDVLRHWKTKGYAVLACIGTVGRRKNQRLLIEAMADSNAPSRIACAIIGEGEEVPILHSLIHETGLQERVQLFGYQPNASTFLSEAHWLVLPSNDEGLPL